MLAQLGSVSTLVQYCLMDPKLPSLHT